MNETNPAPSPVQNSRAAIAGFILAMLGFCLFPLGLIGAVFGVIGIFKTSDDRTPRLKGRGFAIAAVAVAPFQVAISGILMAIAIPNFVRFQDRAKTAEAKVSVRSIYTGVRAYEAEHDALPGSVAMTPPRVPCGKQPVTLTPQQLAPWKDLGYEPGKPVRYSVSYTRSPDGKGFRIEAMGDLNCDGVTSSFSMGPEQTLNEERALE